ncbi:MAG: TIM barrel protein [Oscillospiraceae bacterium]|nr:TIM barrel protein [Oscillospiraceae bacterium]
MKFRDRLYLSTIADDACEVARRHRLGLELAQFCTAANMDDYFDEYGPQAIEHMRSARRFVFHAPFNELCPAAIDPLVLTLTRQRYLQAFALARNLGISRVVVHTGYVPLVYHKSWMVERSIAFWKALLTELPQDLTILLENVMEDGPDQQRAVAEAVDDPRLRLCLDVGHANAECSKTPIPQWIDALAPWLSHVHLHNNEGGWDLHQNLGEGSIPMEDVLRQLESCRTDLTYTIETMHAAPSVDFLQQRGFLERDE